MKKHTLAIVIIITLSLGFAIYYFFTIPIQRPVLVDDDIQTSEPTQNQSIISKTIVDEDGRILFEVDDAAIIATHDIRTSPDTLDIGYGQYQLVDLVNNPLSMYGILYDDNNQSFLIVIRTEEVLEGREAAINTLTSLLDISTEELCQLDISLFIAQDVRSEFAGEELTLLGICD